LGDFVLKMGYYSLKIPLLEVARDFFPVEAIKLIKSINYISLLRIMNGHFLQKLYYLDK